MNREDDPQLRSHGMSEYRDHVLRVLGYPIPVVESGEELITLARKLAAPEFEARLGWRTEPPFPGASEKPEKMETGWRMICACKFFKGDDQMGTLFMTFVSGRPVGVVINVPTTTIPAEYTPILA
jgi:hypothetical protein